MMRQSAAGDGKNGAAGLSSAQLVGGAGDQSSTSDLENSSQHRGRRIFTDNELAATFPRSCYPSANTYTLRKLHFYTKKG